MAQTRGAIQRREDADARIAPCAHPDGQAIERQCEESWEPATGCSENRKDNRAGTWIRRGEIVNIVTIDGSARRDSYTGKALALAQNELRQLKDVTLTAVEPANLKLAIPGSTMDASDKRRLQEITLAADGIILATPEYHGSFSSLMKVTIENMGFPSALKGKPVALLGVAAGRIGAVKSLEHLQSVCIHVGALVLPGYVSVSRVRSLFDEHGNCLDEATERRIRRLASDLVRYIYEARCTDVSFEEWVRTTKDSR